MSPQHEHDSLRGRLEERRTSILRRVGKIEGDLRQPHDRDWTEQASELENDEVLEGLDEMGLAEIRAIGEALRRIQAGTYGFCTECGGPIDDQRLQAVPSTPLCIYCAK